jgi:hypothetical protein
MTGRRYMTVAVISSIVTLFLFPQIIEGASGASSGSTTGGTPCTTVTTVRPAPGFDPRTASVTDLYAHDFPPRSTDPTAAVAWDHYVALYLAGQVKDVELCSPAEVLPDTGVYSTPVGFVSGSLSDQAYDQYDGVWCGYVQHDSPFTDVDGTLVVNPALAPGASIHWLGVGLGNSPTYPLVQAGVVANPGDTYLFVETFYKNAPHGAEKVTGMPNPAYDAIYVHVTFKNHAVAMHIVDETRGYETHQVPSGYDYSSRYPDGHTEAITERFANPDLANFGQATFASVRSFASSWQTLSSSNSYDIAMVGTSGGEDAYPTTPPTNGTFYTIFVQSN